MRKKILFSAVVLVGVFVGAECILRLAGMGPGWRGDVYETIRSNAPGRLNVCVLGGSSANGYPFDPRGGFPEWTEAILRRVVPGGDVQVANCGLDSAASEMLVDVFEHVSRKRLDAVVVYAGHNEWLEAELPITAGMQPLPDTALRARISRTAVYWNLWRLSLWLRGKPTDPEDFAWGMGNVVPTELRASARYKGTSLHEDLRRQVAEKFEANLTRIAERARDRHVALFLCTVAANYSEWPPGLSLPPSQLDKDTYHRWLAHYYSGLDLLETDPAAARGELEQAAAIYRPHAGLLYALGRAAVALGEKEQARTFFDEARDLDAKPSRAKSEMNAIIRKLAQRYDAELVDIEQLFNERSADGSPGFDLFVDNCHPNLRGHRLIGMEVARALERRLAKDQAWTWEKVQDEPALAEQLALDNPFVARSLVRVANRCFFPHMINERARLYGRERFYPMEAASYTELFRQALELSEKTTLSRVLDTNPFCCYHLAAAYRILGRNNSAAQWARRATDLMPGLLDARQLLITIYREAGKTSQAEQEVQQLQRFVEARRE